MKTLLFAAAAMMIATSAASAASDRAGQTATAAQGERDPRDLRRLGSTAEPVMLHRGVGEGRALSGPQKSGGESGSWTGNDH